MSEEPFDQEEHTQVLGAETGTTEGGPVRFTVKAVETIHRRYMIEADSEEQAEGRLRRYFADPSMVAPGIVVRDGEDERVRWKIPTERTD